LLQSSLSSLSDLQVEQILRQLPTEAEVRTETATESLYEFTKQAWPFVESVPYIDGWHIKAWCEHLQAVTEGKIQKLIGNFPPGCSKSLLTSVMWPCWEWASDPTIRWFFASYDKRLSMRDSVKCRTLIKSDWYQSQWPLKFKDDQDQKTYFETTAGGYRLATSIGGHGTGEHPDRIVVDDPNSVKESESAAIRRMTNDWWDQTMATRGASRNATHTAIQQRTNDDDFTGHVCKKEKNWVKVVLPMRFEPGRMETTPLGFNDPRTIAGELLAPKQLPEEKVKEMENTLGSYGAAGQLQQRPVPREGGMFKRQWFTIVDAAPAIGERVRWWDCAATEGDGDFSVGLRMAKSPDGIYYIENVQRGQLSAGSRNALIKQTAETDGKRIRIGGEQEGGSGGKEAAQNIVRLLAGYTVKFETSTGDKATRAEGFAAQAEAGNVRIVRGDWNEVYLDELCVFPNGKHDDQVDASSGAFNKLVSPPKKLWVAFSGEKPAEPPAEQTAENQAKT
jgi:predicted phage terminase large subunit-like protein